MTAIEWLEDRLKSASPEMKEDVKLILLGAESKVVTIDTEFVSNQVFRETNYDLKNNNLTENLGVSSPNRSQIKIQDTLKILRLLHINSGLVYSSIRKCDNVLIDGAIKSIINYKFSPVLNIKGTSINDVFHDISNKKGIPDVSDLYIKGVLSIQDVIGLIENFNGKKFRVWLHENDYDQTEIIRQLMANTGSINLNVSKGIRFLVSNSIGLINPMAGIASAVVDSYLIDKILDGWHPNFFLDNTLKSQIDKKIQEYELKKRNESIKKAFPKTGRNDPCPCGSGKKFKKCHGDTTG